ncbi:MAG: hypothetical protein Q9P01_19035 [Anaerolineae bacterium]|nr:hypothetical protein [Anaerolineae bacterium]MDQ7036846.1 hypothetical protein [Anaerolineae bacterium]
MTFEEVLRVVDQFSEDERQRLRQYLEQMEITNTHTDLKAGTMDVDVLLAAVDDMRRGLSNDDLNEMLAAMNEEYIKPADDNLWDN